MRPWRRWTEQLDLWLPAALVVGLVLAALVGPLFVSDPTAVSLGEARLPPGSPEHLLGTDSLGRDLLSRVLHGARVSLLVGVAAVLLGMVVGGTTGIIAGYWGGVVDTVLMRVIDVVLAFPALVLALAIASALGPSIRNLIVALAVFVIPAYARIARATTLSVRQRDYVTAARFLGLGAVTVVRRHVVPNVIPALVAYGFLVMGIAIIVEAALSFLGLGVRPPQPSWGVMIAEGRADMARSPHLVFVPGAFLFVAVLGVNLLGDALRRRADVRTSTI